MTWEYQAFAEEHGHAVAAQVRWRRWHDDCVSRLVNVRRAIIVPRARSRGARGGA